MRPHTPLFLSDSLQVGLTVELILLDTLLQGIAVTPFISVALEDSSLLLS